MCSKKHFLHLFNFVVIYSAMNIVFKKNGECYEQKIRFSDYPFHR